MKNSESCFKESPRGKGSGMKFPVDFLAEVSQAELEQLARNYMNSLLYSNPDSPEHLILSDSTQVTIDISSVGFVPLYGSSDKQKILALFSPGDPFTAVALYLLDQWWPVDEILKTADPARDGTLEVQTVGERIVLYILNRVIYRAKEMSSEERPFLCHGEKDHAKILWNNGEAAGFYSVKPSGSSCNSFSTRSYQLPVMDSIFVRKCQRGKGFGLQMLEDFVLSFKEDCLGLRYPLTKSMYKVCETYLCQYPGDTGLLWEVESIGGPNQRSNIASKIQAMDMTKVSKSLSFTEESLVITDMTEKDVVMETIATQIKEAESLKCTVEIVEDLTVQRDTKDRGRSNASKQRKMGEKLTEDKSENIIRIEDIEAETPRKEQLHNISELLQTEGMFSVIPEEKGKDVVDTAPKEEATTMSDKQATVLASQDLEEADVTLAPKYEEPQVEDLTQDLNNTYHDSQITVENLASETEAAVDECHKENVAVLVVSEEVLEVNKKFETQMEVTERFEESVTQHEISLSRHATSQDVEAGKTGRTVVKAIKTVQSETRRQKSQRHKNPEEEVKEEATAQEGGRVLRGRTIKSNPTLKHKYGQSEELKKEVDEVAEENRQGEASVRNRYEESRNSDKGGVNDEEEGPAKETKALRKGKMCALATPCKSKQVHTQCQPEEEEEDGNPEKKEKAVQESPEHRGEKPQEEDVEEKDGMSFAGGESALGDAKQMKDALTKKAAVLEKEDNRVAAMDGIGTDTVEISLAEIEDTIPDSKDRKTKDQWKLSRKRKKTLRMRRCIN
ncbi:soluble lamin-associated protein of 75 kDa-like [Pempheris klunzingeri]|uniref:soluble lamin-associated protein of 75 kDa-like n=1 Tax=Pempheris klunzingeri TaxID=3127111 RepID=UPI00397EF0BB